MSIRQPQLTYNSPDLLNSSAEDKGWILEIEAKDFENEKKELLNAEDYKKHAESEAH